MPISLEELKKQREQVLKMLDWLDAKIAELNVGSEEAENDKQATTPEEEGPSGAQAASASPDQPEGDEDVEVSEYQAQTSDEIVRAKVGCFLLFILGIVLVLFLIFGLPHYVF